MLVLIGTDSLSHATRTAVDSRSASLQHRWELTTVRTVLTRILNLLVKYGVANWWRELVWKWISQTQQRAVYQDCFFTEDSGMTAKYQRLRDAARVADRQIQELEEETGVTAAAEMSVMAG